MKNYNVITTVHSTDGSLFVGDPIVLSEKGLEEISLAVNTRQAIRITVSTTGVIKQRFFPFSSIDYIEVVAKEIVEEKTK